MTPVQTQDALDIALQPYLEQYAHWPKEVKDRMIADMRKWYTDNKHH